MKVLFCIDSFRPSRGGAEAYLRDLGEALVKRGHRVAVACAEKDDDAVLETRSIAVPRRPRLLRELVLARAPGRFQAGSEWDAVVAFRHAFSADLFQPHGGPHIESMRGAVRAFSRGAASRLLLLLKIAVSPKNLFFLHADRVLFRGGGCSHVVALSRMTADAVRARLGGRADQCRIDIIPNGVDGTRFHPGLREVFRNKVREEEAVPEDLPLLLFVGHNFRLKGLEEAIRGAAAFSGRGFDFRLLVVGRKRHGRYARLAHRLGIASNVRFLGEQKTMEELYGAADLLLHPTWYDPCSLVVLEALGAGVPVITTKYNGASELMTSGKEGVVLDDPADEEAVADALQGVLGNGHLTFRRKAAQLGESLDFRFHLERMEELLMAAAST